MGQVLEDVIYTGVVNWSVWTWWANWPSSLLLMKWMTTSEVDSLIFSLIKFHFGIGITYGYH